MRRFTLIALSALVTALAPASTPSGELPAIAPTIIQGARVLKVTLDRDYMVIGNDRTPTKDAAVYMLNPQDGQSSLVIGIGEDVPTKDDRRVAEMHDGAVVTVVPGVINGVKVGWRHYRDRRHLYSDCSVRIRLAGSPEAKDVKVEVMIVANSEVRLKALEDCLSKIEISEKK